MFRLQQITQNLNDFLWKFFQRVLRPQPLGQGLRPQRRLAKLVCLPIGHEAFWIYGLDYVVNHKWTVALNEFMCII